MKTFPTGKTIHRLVKIRRIDPAMDNTEWVLSFAENGLSVRRAGAPRADVHRLPWKAVIGLMLVHTVPIVRGEGR